MKEIKEDWLLKNDTLYKEAAAKSDPKVRFQPSSFTKAIDDNQDKINASTPLLNSLREINRNLERNVALPAETARINKTAKTDFGNNAAAEMYKLMEYMKQTQGMSAKEGNDTIVRILNEWDDGSLKPREMAVITKLREAILVDTVDGIGGDIFLAARKNFAEMQDLIETFPVMERLGFKKSGTQGKAGYSEDEIFNKLVLKANSRDFNEFMDLLEHPRYAAKLAPVKESLKDNIFGFIKSEAVSGPLDKANQATFVPAKYEKALDKVAAKGMDRLKRVLTQEEIQALGTIRRYTEFLREPMTRKSALNPSNTAVQALSGAVGILNRSKAGNALISAIGSGSEKLQAIIDNLEMNRRLAGKNVPGDIAEMEKIVHKNPKNGLPSPSPAAAQAGVTMKDREEQQRNAIEGLLKNGAKAL